jgi:hydrogenase maturation protein HypF
MRPFVWRLAGELGLAGFVRNIPTGIEIEVEGTRVGLNEFHRRLTRELPSAAAIDNIKVNAVALRGEKNFQALPSERGRVATTVPPDLATCPDCIREIFDPDDRRFRYPFTNCTSCGPRFTVVRTLPYDRPSTSLSDFQLCAECKREYLDPSNRRFRAEPIACPECGPRAWLESSIAEGNSEGEDAISGAAAILRRGGIVAVQGIGGVHLACDANDEAAVARLRRVKSRPRKPLAVMVESLSAARRLAIVSDGEAELLTQSSAPIVILRKLDDARLAPSVAPGNDHVGIMIAYSPLHHLLMRDVGRPLVMTSGNRPGEPITRDADEARQRFAEIVDALLLHNRPIHQRCDDGVWMVASKGVQPLRLSRGSTPRSLTVPVEAPVPILGAGGDIKNSFTLLTGRTALMSQYIGSLGHTATQDHFRDALDRWIAMSGVTPAVVAHDMHPQSFTRDVVRHLGLRAIAVQHHHAHVASCLAEHGRMEAAIGIAFDGLGYGTDGSLWGGEAMRADLCGFQRLSHLQYLPLAGGDAAVRRPAQIAAAFLIEVGSRFDGRVEALVGEDDARILKRMIARSINTFQTSSCGRLFDAVSALLGVCCENTYEAQAAIELESLARTSPSTNYIYPASLRDGVVSTAEILASIADDLDRGAPVAKIARAFHDTMAEVVARMAADARLRSGLNVVALSGGCFQNRLLLDGSIHRLERAGFEVLVHNRVPANDGGLALGQAAVAAALLSAEQSGGSSCVSGFLGE